MNLETITVPTAPHMPPLIGDNVTKDAAALRAVIERIENMEAEKKQATDDIRDIYVEAKGGGYEIKALRTIVRMRKMNPTDRAEQETILDTYMQAMGML